MFEKIEIGEDYLHRWYIIPRNKFFNIYLHNFMGSDDDRALHDHPWWSVSFLLKGKLTEVVRKKGFEKYENIIPFLPKFRKATHAHRLILTKGPAWTLFITGPRTRMWGFLCPNEGWMDYKTYLNKHGSRYD